METSSIALRRLMIQQLEPDLNNVLIIGIIIAKQRPRKFTSTGKDGISERGVWNFTLRDTPRDYINCTFWGQGEEIWKLAEAFQIGDVVEVTRPRISIRAIDNHGEQFRPTVTSPYTLTLYDNQSRITRYQNPNEFLRLLRYPTKPLAIFVTIADVQSRDITSAPKYVDMLVAVRSIGVVRNVKTKSGIEQEVRDFTVLDHTSEGVRMTTWDPELIARIGFWKPRTTILFLADVKVEYSHFHKSIMPVIGSRTIITEDPIGQEAEQLRNYASTAPLLPSHIIEQLMSRYNPTTIKNIMTINQVQQKVDSMMSSSNLRRLDDRHFVALLYCMVSHLDLDGLLPVTTTRCKRCKYLINNNQLCENEECVSSRGIEMVDLETTFDIRVNLSDHTGSINNCRLVGTTAEEILGCSVQKFINMSDHEKGELKWKYLLERCEIRIIVLCTKNANSKISILSCSRSSPIDFASNIPIC
nr:meiosis-specific with OB domain-containing protein [Onthophagus taurus]